LTFCSKLTFERGSNTKYVGWMFQQDDRQMAVRGNIDAEFSSERKPLNRGGGDMH
jgi:hypothetical protein